MQIRCQLLHDVNIHTIVVECVYETYRMLCNCQCSAEAHNNKTITIDLRFCKLAKSMCDINIAN